MLHTWGSALTHHPHVHGIVPGGGLSSDGERWIACRRGFFLPVRVLSRLFRRRFLEELAKVHDSGQLQFFGEHAALADATAFADWLAPLRQCEWVVYAKRPFAGPAAVLAYLSRYTHRVAIFNQRLVAMDEHGVTFRWKDYRAKVKTRHKTMTLEAPEFMRRFLLHVLPGGFHRIRHYGLLANAGRRANLARVCTLLGCEAPATREAPQAGSAESIQPTFVCPCCGAAMRIIETFLRHQPIRAPPRSRGPP
ncbi:Putative transposase [Noviherbaspirillum suwonense]|uniref:Transposase n=1 Tax=Noviherbaspirillum suwonense TaxID=1224511 RepID=A0ABY1PXC3_9BURK|nr:Putative transposase [Noviherbaspirillum suwonense]